MVFSFSSCPADKNVHGYQRVGYSCYGYERGDISGDYGDDRGGIIGDIGRRGFRPQDTSRSSLYNCLERFYGDGIGGSRSQTIHSSYHKPGDLGRFCFYMLLLVVFTKVIMSMKEVIVAVTVKDVDSGLKRPATLHFTLVEKLLMVMVEVDIGLRQSPLPTTIQVILVDFLVYLFMVMI